MSPESKCLRSHFDGPTGEGSGVVDTAGAGPFLPASVDGSQPSDFFYAAQTALRWIRAEFFGDDDSG